MWDVIENSFLCNIYKSSAGTGFAKQIMPILRIFQQGGENRAGFIVVGAPGIQNVRLLSVT
jgi:hypothetical protein